MSGNSNKLIAFNYFGGKFTWVEYLYRYFPNEFNHLCELFGGSFAVSLNYPNKRVIKTVNEINGEITNFFEQLRTNEAELIRLLYLTPCSKLEYEKCWEHSDDPLEQARRFYVRVRQSFFGLGAQRRNKGWHMAKSKVNCNGGETVSRWNNAIDKLEDVANAIRNNLQIVNGDYFDCIKRVDTVNTFFYADPPYPKQSRASYNDYRFEFSNKQHEQLADDLHSIDGKAMISGYDCPMMNSLYSDWNKVKLPVKKNNIRSGDVQEVIWFNYDVKPKPTNLKLTL